MSAPLELPPGLPVEVEFQRETRPNLRGLVPAPIDYDARGFELLAVAVPEHLAFGDEFRVEFERRWLNLDTVAQIRYLSPDAVRVELQRLADLHEGVRARLAAHG